MSPPEQLWERWLEVREVGQNHTEGKRKKNNEGSNNNDGWRLWWEWRLSTKPPHHPSARDTMPCDLAVNAVGCAAQSVGRMNA